MVMVNQNRVDLLQYCLAQEPTIDVLQLLASKLPTLWLMAARPRFVPRAIREQQTIGVTVAGLVPVTRREGADETTPFVDILQQILDPHARHACLDSLAPAPHLRQNRKRVRLLQLSALDRACRKFWKAEKLELVTH
jgi:hypothetical protein